ncbi:MAG: hypothetical protein JSV49_03750 [Thermoplasmata archaeon]|nr:MAG: hypothetical protein JSV49_03750 [Thermoplasmata archaeon]
MDKHRLFLALWIGTIIVFIVSIFSPWWYSVEERKEDQFVERYRSEWFLTKVSTEYESDLEPSSDWSSSYDPDEFDFPRVAELWLRSFYIVLLGLVLNFAVLWIYLRFRQFKTTQQWVITITALATVVTLIIPIFVTVGLPIAITNDTNYFHYPSEDAVYTSFWGEDSFSELDGILETKYEWGPRYGWGLFWLAFVFDLSMLFIIRPPPRPTESDRTKTPAEVEVGG